MLSDQIGDLGARFVGLENANDLFLRVTLAYQIETSLGSILREISHSIWVPFWEKDQQLRTDAPGQNVLRQDANGNARRWQKNLAREKLN